MDLLIGLPVLIFSTILHEVAHGYVADRFGDPTARLMGRLTLNPIPHIDPFMSIILPVILIVSGSPIVFASAKPVPVDEYNLRDGRKDIALVALVGPLTNLLLAVLGSLVIRFLLTPFGSNLATVDVLSVLYTVFHTVVFYNLLLAIFNLFPIPPLDGSKVFSLLLPEKEARAYLSLSSVGMFILFFLLVFPIGGFSLMKLLSTLLQFGLGILIP